MLHAVGDPAAASHTLLPNQHYTRTGTKSQVENPQKPALKHESVKATELRLKKTFSRTQEGEDHSNRHPGLVSPGQEVHGAEDHAYCKKHQGLQAFAGKGFVTQAFDLQFGESAG